MSNSTSIAEMPYEENSVGQNALIPVDENRIVY